MLINTERESLPRMVCNHEHPELCELLGKHIVGGLLHRWNDAPKYRRAWCERAGVDLSEMEQRFPPTNEQQQTPATVKVVSQQPQVETGTGAGSYLKRGLRRLGIHASPTCPCNHMVLKMNANGPDWCADNVEAIIDVMETEAKKRPIAGLVFSRLVAARLVNGAIRKARRDLEADDNISQD